MVKLSDGRRGHGLCFSFVTSVILYYNRSAVQYKPEISIDYLPIKIHVLYRLHSIL